MPVDLDQLVGREGDILDRAGKLHAARDFTDVTLGTNGAYAAGQGWDYVSGFGTPRVAGLIRDVDHRR